MHISSLITNITAPCLLLQLFHTSSGKSGSIGKSAGFCGGVVCSLPICLSFPCSGVLWMQKWRSLLLRTTAIKGSLFETWHRSEYSLACLLPGILPDWLISTFSFHSTLMFLWFFICNMACVREMHQAFTDLVNCFDHVILKHSGKTF